MNKRERAKSNNNAAEHRCSSGRLQMGSSGSLYA